MTWKPISSAPRDGTEVLLWDGSGQAVCHWDGKHWALIYTGWHAVDSQFDDPTHWMPLPEPPKETDDGR
ncbi:DUF551 domain-containing protein [Stenotrophomonas maltophilia]|uniref:DUF551 domain-containing protein n=1 Tax=Stenotrophomonas maltophilia TaxID=40324 RepID=UPI003D023189